MKRILTIALAALAMTLIFSTCKPPVTSVNDCLDSFMDDISSTDRSEVYKNLDSDATAYNIVKAASYWEFYFPVAEVPYTLSGRSQSGDYVQATISSSGVGFGTKTIIFTMSEDSDGNALIRQIVLGGVGVYN
jgi:hypothetical protein